MTEYLDINFESDPDALASLAFAYLQSQVPNWAPSEGNLDVMIIRAISQVAAEVQDMAASVPTTIFRYFGANVASITPQDATAAQASTTWTMQDTAGYTVPAGTQVGIQSAGDQLVAFEVLNDTVIAPGSNVATGVIIEAIIPGADGSGLSGDVVMIDSLGFVSTVVLDSQTTGGTDAEEDSDYLNRLATEFTLLAPRPIVPDDFAAMAASAAGVQRALALDGYDPVANTYGNERMIALAMIDQNGLEVSSTLKTQILQMLEDRREVNFIINIVSPTYTAVDITFQVRALPGFDATDLSARIINALSDQISPDTWGLPNTGDTIAWLNESTVRYLSIAATIKDVQGVDFVEALTIGLSGGGQTAADNILPGAVPLPLPGAILGTVDVP